MKKISLKFENRIIYKCRMWLSVVRWLRKTIFEPTKKSIFKIEIFWSEIEVKKFLWNWKIEFATNAEYDTAWSADHEKLYLSPSKNHFLDRNFLVRNWGEKNFFEIGKLNWLKMQDTTQRDALITKNYIWAHQKINF